MPSGLSGGDGFQLLSKVLDLRQRAHERIAENIANQDTPGYKARRLEFEGALRKAAGAGDTLRPTGSGMAPANRFAQVTGTETVITDGANSDGNTVNAEEEMSLLSENALMYDLASQILANKYRGLRNVIREGR